MMERLVQSTGRDMLSSLPPAFHQGHNCGFRTVCLTSAPQSEHS
jgi:hypothetical protein